MSNHLLLIDHCVKIGFGEKTARLMFVDNTELEKHLTDKTPGEINKACS